MYTPAILLSLSTQANQGLRAINGQVKRITATQAIRAAFIKRILGRCNNVFRAVRWKKPLKAGCQKTGSAAPCSLSSKSIRRWRIRIRRNSRKRLNFKEIEETENDWRLAYRHRTPQTRGRPCFY